MTKNSDKTILVNGVSYQLADLSDEAKNQLVNLRVTDQEITHLNQRLAIAQTARVAYSNALAAALPKTENTVQ